MKRRKVIDWVPRNAPGVPHPQWAATKVFDDNTGEDVAYFFSKKDRDDYLKFKNGQVGLRRT